MSLPDHLGGHKNRTHLDHGVIDYMINTFNIESFIDIGCGPGGMVNLAQEKGLRSLGIDGDYTISRKGDNFVIHDYTTGPTNFNDTFDMAWSCEFVEHVDEKYVENYMPDFQRAKYVVMTHSEKPGYHHVNLKPAEYWIDVFKEAGFDYDDEQTSAIRSATTMNTTGKHAYNIKKMFIKTHGLFFRK